MKLIFTAFFLTSYFFTFAQLSEINTGLNGIELAEEDYELYIEKHKINVTTTSLSEKQKYSRARIFYTQPKDLFLLAKNVVVIDHGKHKQNVFIESDYSENELAVARGLGLKVQIIIDDVKAHYVAQNNEQFSMWDATDGVIPLAWENIDGLEEYPENRLIFPFGIKLSEVNDKLYERDIRIKFKKEYKDV